MSAKRADAEGALIIAAQRALSKNAFGELFACDSISDVRRWARRWNVDAPAFIRHADELRHLHVAEEEQASIATGARRLDTWHGGRPTEWTEVLSRLDRLPLSILRESLSERIATGHLKEYKNTALAHDDSVLAPLAADPSVETKRDFLARAGEHYVARDLRLNEVARAVGFSPIAARRAPQLHRHIDWLVRFNVQGRHFQDIARDAKLGVGGEERVRVAVNRLARLLKLRLRPLNAGRPRKAARKGNKKLSA